MTGLLVAILIVRHLDLILASRDTVARWQVMNNARTPNSEASRAWMGDDA